MKVWTSRSLTTRLLFTRSPVAVSVCCLCCALVFARLAGKFVAGRNASARLPGASGPGVHRAPQTRRDSIGRDNSRGLTFTLTLAAAPTRVQAEGGAPGLAMPPHLAFRPSSADET